MSQSPPSIPSPSNDDAFTKGYSLRKRKPPPKQPSPSEEPEGGKAELSSLSSISDSDSEHSPPVGRDDEESEEDEYRASDEDDEFDAKKKKRKGAAATVKGKKSGGTSQSQKKGGSASGSAAGGRARAPPLGGAGFYRGPPPPTISRSGLLPPPHGVESRFTPALHAAYIQLWNVLAQARNEARSGDPTYQAASQAAVEASIRRLPTQPHRVTLCLNMNRYTVFCTSAPVKISPFPITAPKIALFLVRATPSPMGRAFRSLMPQTATHPLPFADDPDRQGLTQEEGASVTLALAKSWMEAFAYVQAATRDIWNSIDPNLARGDEQLLLDPLISELNYCFGGPLAPHVVGQASLHAPQRQLKRPTQESGSMMATTDNEAVEVKQEGEGDPPPQKKTKWVKGGQPVNPPSTKGSVPFSHLAENVTHRGPPDFSSSDSPRSMEGSVTPGLESKPTNTSTVDSQATIPTPQPSSAKSPAGDGLDWAPPMTPQSRAPGTYPLPMSNSYSHVPLIGGRSQSYSMPSSSSRQPYPAQPGSSIPLPTTYSQSNSGLPAPSASQYRFLQQRQIDISQAQAQAADPLSRPSFELPGYLPPLGYRHSLPVPGASYNQLQQPYPGGPGALRMGNDGGRSENQPQGNERWGERHQSFSTSSPTNPSNMNLAAVGGSAGGGAGAGAGESEGGGRKFSGSMPGGLGSAQHRPSPLATQDHSTLSQGSISQPGSGTSSNFNYLGQPSTTPGHNETSYAHSPSSHAGSPGFFNSESQSQPQPQRLQPYSIYPSPAQTQPQTQAQGSQQHPGPNYPSQAYFSHNNSTVGPTPLSLPTMLSSYPSSQSQPRWSAAPPPPPPSTSNYATTPPGASSFGSQSLPPSRQGSLSGPTPTSNLSLFNSIHPSHSGAGSAYPTPAFSPQLGHVATQYQNQQQQQLHYHQPPSQPQSQQQLQSQSHHQLQHQLQQMASPFQGSQLANFRAFESKTLQSTTEGGSGSGTGENDAGGSNGGGGGIGGGGEQMFQSMERVSSSGTHFRTLEGREEGDPAAHEDES